MNGRTRPGERGFTLIELVIAVAVVVTTVAAGIGLSVSARSLAVATALSEFDHLLDSTRTIARQTDGATIVFSADAYGDGTEARVLTTGPGGALVATAMPVFHTRAEIAEAQSLGGAPFAFIVHATGLLRGRPGFRAGDVPARPELDCPPSGSWHFTIRAAGATADRFVPCRIDLAATGSVVLATWPPAPVAPLPTACASCTVASVPPAPSSSPTCPPGYVPITGGCAPSTAPPAATAAPTPTPAAAGATPSATPTPAAACDLSANGKCYHLLVPQTNQQFTKFVAPDTQCATDPVEYCWYVDRVRSIDLNGVYSCSRNYRLSIQITNYYL